MNSPPDPFVCPVCESCDHDIRGAVLEFMANVQGNLGVAAETLLDAIEADGPGTELFLEATAHMSAVVVQLAALIDFTDGVARLKFATATKD